MRKAISLILTVSTFLFNDAAVAQTRSRQQLKRAQPVTKAAQKQNLRTVPPEELVRQELAKLLEVAAKAESALSGNPRGSNFIMLRTQLLSIQQSSAMLSLTDGPALQAMSAMLDAYSDAHRLHDFARYKFLTVGEFIQKEKRKEEEDRAGMVQTIKELRRRALYEDDPIRRDELRDEANFYESSMRYRHSIVSDTTAQPALLEAKRKEMDEEGKQAATIVSRKYGLRDTWAEDPLKFVNAVVDVGAKYRGVLERYLVEPHSINAMLAQVQQSLVPPTTVATATLEPAATNNSLMGTWTLDVTINGSIASFTRVLRSSRSA